MTTFDDYADSYPLARPWFTYMAIESPLNDATERIIEHAPEAEASARQVQRRMTVILALSLAMMGILALTLPPLLSASAGEDANNTAVSPPTGAETTTGETAVSAPSAALSPVFTPEVRHWEPQILAWAETHDLDPNLVATVMQIESCGDPNAVSSAGAQGLFQVMPFHFHEGEPMQDPETNARRGVGYLKAQLARTNDPGMAMASYNGGPGVSSRAWEQWPAETRRYYEWGAGIYGEASSGATESATLGRWLKAGGASLCRQAAQRLNLSP